MSDFLFKLVVSLLIGCMGMLLVGHSGGPEWSVMMTGWISVTIVLWSSKT